MRKIASVFAAAGLAAFIFASPAAPQGVPETGLAWRPVSYELDLRIDYEKEIVSGRCRLTVRNAAAEAVSEMPLLLYRLMKVTAVRDEGGRDVKFSQSVRSFEDWEAIQANAVTLSLSQAVPPGGERVFSIDYEGLLFGYAAEGMSYVKDRIDKDFTILRQDAFAYPQIGVPSWKINRAAGLPEFTYVLRLTVPDSLTVANGGKLIGRTPGPGTTTYVYESLRPSWRIDAAAANYTIIEDAARGFKVFCLPGDEAGGRTVLRSMGEATALFADWFGPAPGASSFAVIEVPAGFGSQADETVILQTRDAFTDRDKLIQLYHEISHRWGVRALDPLPSRFENEGLAMFLQFLAREKLEKRPGALAQGAESLRVRFVSQCARSERARTTAMIDFGTANLTDLSYSKGMLFFYGLYRLAGEKEFLSAVRVCLGNFRKDGATTRQFLGRLQSALNRPLDRYYQDWVFEGAASSDDLKGGRSLDEIFAKYKN
jgi:hypothetical protein